MNRNEFFKRLSGNLKKMAKDEQDEIIMDFTEHIDYAVKQGNDETEVIERLGDPKKIAKEYYMQKVIEEANSKKSFSSMGRAVVASAGLSIVNFLYAICVVAVGYIVIASLYIAICSAGLGGLAGVAISILVYGVYGPLAGWLGIFTSLALVALCVLGFIGTMRLAGLFRQGNMRFLNMTRKGIKGGLSDE